MSTIQIESSHRQQPATFRFSAEFRRIGVYLVLGFIVLVGTTLGLQLAGLLKRWEVVATEPAVLALFMLGPAALLFRQLLRVDQDGIWRRRIWHWDLWPWEAFANGSIREGPWLDSFAYPAKPWWYRQLLLEFLDADDRAAVLERINQVWKPLQPQLPETITIRQLLHPLIMLTPEGIRIGEVRDGVGRPATWDDVLEVQIDRLRHGRADFTELKLTLAQGRPLKFHVRQGNPSWRGPGPEVVLSYLQKYVPAGRLHFTALKGAPQTVEEINRRIGLLDSREWQMRHARPVIIIWLAACVPLFLFGVLQIHRHNPLHWDLYRWIGAGLVALILSILAVANWLGISEQQRRLQAERDELERWERRLAGDQ